MTAWWKKKLAEYLVRLEKYRFFQELILIVPVAALCCLTVLPTKKTRKLEKVLFTWKKRIKSRCLPTSGIGSLKILQSAPTILLLSTVCHWWLLILIES